MSDAPEVKVTVAEKVRAALAGGIEMEIVGGRWCGVRTALQGTVPLPVLYLRGGVLEALAGHAAADSVEARRGGLVEFRRLPVRPADQGCYKYAEVGTCGV